MNKSKNNIESRFIFLWICFGSLLFQSKISYAQYVLQKMSVVIESRKIFRGKMNKVKGTLYYHQDGRVISYFDEPTHLIIMNTNKGDLTVYDPEKNTVIRKSNFTENTESSLFYYFLSNQKFDLGLSDLHYTLSNTKFKDGMKITTWAPPKNMPHIGKVELVHQNNNPIYMAYYNTNKEIIKKVYFYKYSKVENTLDFPNALTQIDFVSKKDSMVSKTTFSSFHVNQEVSDSYFQFVVPNNATVLEK